MKILVIASGNAGKIREFQGLLQALPVSVEPQPEGLEVEETGTTFAANARLKAQAVAAATGEWALADDSGLSVDALNGAPGVHSARYAPTDPERIARLLKEAAVITTDSTCTWPTWRHADGSRRCWTRARPRPSPAQTCWR